MTTVQFQPATKRAAKLRMALDGPAGSGKTYTALAVATALAQPVALVDTEHGSASKYADLFEFATLELESFHPERYMEAIGAAEAAGFGTLILDSLSHAWTGKDGTLELVDRAAKRSTSGNSFAAWKDVTPIQNALIERIISSKLHIIVTLRVKTEYVIQTNDKGRQEPRKVGLAPVQRDQLEYEFDVYGRLDPDNNLVITKTRCPVLAGQVIPRPGAELAQTLNTWLSGAPEMVTSADNRIWQHWLKRKGEAEGMGVKDVPALSLPIALEELKARGTDLFNAIEARKDQLAKEDAARAAGKVAHDSNGTHQPAVIRRAELWAENRRLVEEAQKRGIQGQTLNNRVGEDVLVTANTELRARIENFDLDQIAAKQAAF